MSNPNPTLAEVREELAGEIRWLLGEVEELEGKISLLADDVRGGFGQGSSRVAHPLELAVDLLRKAAEEIDSAKEHADGYDHTEDH